MLSVAEVGALERAAESDQDAALFSVAAFTGLRLGELRALRWRDVDFSGRIVHVRQNFVAGEMTTPKVKRVRSVPLIDQAAVALDGLSLRSGSWAMTISCSRTRWASRSTLPVCAVGSGWLWLRRACGTSASTI